MPRYNQKDFDPPAPVAQVTLRNPDSGSHLEIQMLIDTGADVTLVPQSVATDLGLIPATNLTYELEGFEGSTVISPVVRLELVFLRRTFRGQFLLTNESYGILGRNILNVMALFYDGPKLIWDELRPTRRD